MTVWAGSGGLTAQPLPAPARPQPRRGAPLGRRTAAAVAVGRLTAGLSRRMRLGAGTVIGGRVAFALDPRALARLAVGRRVVLVSGTNGKTTTAHMLAAALRTLAPVAHNAGGANMADGALAALMADPAAPLAVLEVDELHLGRIAATVRPTAVVLLNLTRDQLDRGWEVHEVAGRVSAALADLPDTLVVANADDPVVVCAAEGAARVRWVGGGTAWLGDASLCPRCAEPVAGGPGGSGCGCAQPEADWRAQDDGVAGPAGTMALRLRLPGRFNVGNAAMALAAADALGVPPDRAAGAVAALTSVAGRYAVVRRPPHELHLYLAKNPAGWTGTLPLLARAPSLLLVVNARQADGRDTSWLWDVPFERLPVAPTMAAGERAADLGLRLSYADRAHRTEPDPLAALALLPAGEVAVVANYTAFHRLRRLAAGGTP